MCEARSHGAWPLLWAEPMQLQTGPTESPPFVYKRGCDCQDGTGVEMSPSAQWQLVCLGKDAEMVMKCNLIQHRPWSHRISLLSLPCLETHGASSGPSGDKSPSRHPSSVPGHP